MDKYKIYQSIKEMLEICENIEYIEVGVGFRNSESDYEYEFKDYKYEDGKFEQLIL